ncbi:MAG TPA: nickel-responsive transcriptional regulator NikR [Thermoplasmata archaeon]|nr:nickel-responsive transcriptional regulator NikR [Thermoplasmata archaeon]
MTVERVGVSLEPELLRRFDRLRRRKGYSNRSEAIRDLVRKALIEAETRPSHADVIGTLTIVYDHHVGDVNDQLLHIQHHHHTEIQSTTHVHVDEDYCLEVLIVRGKAGDVRRLADTIRAVRGVKHGELVITQTSP